MARRGVKEIISCKRGVVDTGIQEKLSAEIEVYPARHGWCVADMPIEKGAPIYNATQAERAWGKLLALYKAALV